MSKPYSAKLLMKGRTFFASWQNELARRAKVTARIAQDNIKALSDLQIKPKDQQAYFFLQLLVLCTILPMVAGHILIDNEALLPQQNLQQETSALTPEIFAAHILKERFHISSDLSVSEQQGCRQVLTSFLTDKGVFAQTRKTLESLPDVRFACVPQEEINQASKGGAFKHIVLGGYYFPKRQVVYYLPPGGAYSEKVLTHILEHEMKHVEVVSRLTSAGCRIWDTFPLCGQIDKVVMRKLYAALLIGDRRVEQFTLYLKGDALESALEEDFVKEVKEYLPTIRPIVFINSATDKEIKEGIQVGEIRQVTAGKLKFIILERITSLLNQHVTKETVDEFSALALLPTYVKNMVARYVSDNPEEQKKQQILEKIAYLEATLGAKLFNCFYEEVEEIISENLREAKHATFAP